MKHIAFLSICTIAITAFSSAGILTGCLFPVENYRAVNYYTLEIPKTHPLPKGASITIESFANGSSCTGRMLYRKNKYLIETDDYNKWIQPPQLLITEYLKSALSGTFTPSDSEKQHLVLSGIIDCFEIDLETKRALLGVSYNIKTSTRDRLLLSRTETFTGTFKENKAPEFASAMSEAAAKFTAALLKDIEYLEKKQAQADAQAGTD